MKYMLLLLAFCFVSVSADVDVEAVKKQIEQQKQLLKSKPKGAFFGKRMLKKKIERKIQTLEKSIKGY